MPKASEKEINDREERRKRFEKRQLRKIDMASDPNTLVFNPQGAETQVFLFLSNSVDSIFRQRRRQEIDAGLEEMIKLISSKIKFRKALLEFSDALKEIAKERNREYVENDILKRYRKDIQDEEKKLEGFLGGNMKDDEPIANEQKTKK